MGARWAMAALVALVVAGLLALEVLVIYLALAVAWLWGLVWA